MLKSLAATLVFASGLAVSAPALAAPNDYSKDENWLCRPGRKDACAVDQSTTIVAANGDLMREDFKADPKAPIDCFYVYPTVSTDPGGNSDMVIDHAERRVVEQQLARFGAKCRLFAPMYRQITLEALRSNMMGKPIPMDPQLGFNDVRDAWADYLKRDNGGRGVVLIGHSQGARVLQGLLRDEAAMTPAKGRIVSALILGMNTPVGADKTFASLPPCTAASQTGCYVSYVSFREVAPPPANSRFGRATEPGMTAACVNPAALGGGSAPLKAYLTNGSTTAPNVWVKPEKKIDTPFVAVPGLLTGTCVEKDGASYLSVKVNADPADPRTDVLTGDVIANGKVLDDWGLHLIDVNLTMGNLVEIVGAQGAAWGHKGHH
ncbi:DUF3089 domain-containing protein [Caulobacter sp. NIBR2454]|uniref:DUF3089 domain-containing protein n=1 Tax=Caulobacter sp. NIBR2454 TaxID=3015996 RepID=UPI0022B6B98E|nr:DUF3089 domain-containing protein [Caulobacter sp. NIBR2454]